LIEEKDILDGKLFQEGGVIVKFSLNYRAEIDGKWYEIYRIDSYHKFIHEQKFWRSDKPTTIRRTPILVRGEEVNEWIKQIQENYKRYRSLFEKKVNE
jgi:hypothetical protein